MDDIIIESKMVHTSYKHLNTIETLILKQVEMILHEIDRFEIYHKDNDMINDEIVQI